MNGRNEWDWVRKKTLKIAIYLIVTILLSRSGTTISIQGKVPFVFLYFMHKIYHPFFSLLPVGLPIGPDNRSVNNIISLKTAANWSLCLSHHFVNTQLSSRLPAPPDSAQLKIAFRALFLIPAIQCPLTL